MDLPTIWRAAVIGLGATLLMDVWNVFLKRAFGLSSLNYCLLGRWVLHMPGGTFAHEHIAQTQAKRFECPAGYLAHYSIGVVFAILFVLIAPAGWLNAPSLLPALLFGIATVALPYFVMQPALGLGIASAKAPNPAQARLKSLGTHVIFGLGLYLAAIALRATTVP